MPSEYDALLESTPAQKSEYDALLAQPSQPKSSVLGEIGTAIKNTAVGFVKGLARPPSLAEIALPIFGGQIERQYEHAKAAEQAIRSGQPAASSIAQAYAPNVSELASSEATRAEKIQAGVNIAAEVAPFLVPALRGIGKYGIAGRSLSDIAFGAKPEPLQAETAAAEQIQKGGEISAQKPYSETGAVSTEQGKPVISETAVQTQKGDTRQTPAQTPNAPQVAPAVPQPEQAQIRATPETPPAASATVTTGTGIPKAQAMLAQTGESGITVSNERVSESTNRGGIVGGSGAGRASIVRLPEGDQGNLAGYTQGEAAGQWFHGSHENIESFRPREVAGVDSIGTWFTGDKTKAGQLYGPNVTRGEVTPRNLLEAHTDNYGDFFYSNKNLFKELFPNKSVSELDTWKSRRGKPSADQVKYLSAFRQMLTDAGYDGVVWKNSRIDLNRADTPHDVMVSFHQEPIPVSEGGTGIQPPISKEIKGEPPAASATVTTGTGVPKAKGVSQPTETTPAVTEPTTTYDPKDKIVGVAIKKENGEVVVGVNHPDARIKTEGGYAPGVIDGFVTASGKFLDRKQALEQVLSSRQLPNSFIKAIQRSKDPELYLEDTGAKFEQEVKKFARGLETSAFREANEQAKTQEGSKTGISETTQVTTEEVPSVRVRRPSEPVLVRDNALVTAPLVPEAQPATTSQPLTQTTKGGVSEEVQKAQDEGQGRQGVLAPEAATVQPPAVPPETPEELGQALKEPPKLAGVSNRVLQERYARGEIPQAPESGKGVLKEDLVRRANEIYSPERVQVAAEKVMRGEANLDDHALVTLQEEKLTKIASDAERAMKANPNDPVLKQAYDEAVSNQQQWQHEVVPPMKLLAHNQMINLQGATNVDTGTLVGLQKLAWDTGKGDFTPEQKPIMNEAANRVAAAESAEKAAIIKANETAQKILKPKSIFNLNELRESLQESLKTMTC